MPETQKRKRPPTFQHFPEKRAKILKQAWVKNTKLKSKWKAEKRKSGLGRSHTQEKEIVGDAEVEAEVEAPETAVQERAPTPPPPPPKKRERRNQSDAESLTATPTLRDRAREAYSKTSLHTYRLDPFGKRERGGKAGTTGRGQPNMKKRMDVLLETIKRDFT